MSKSTDPRPEAPEDDSLLPGYVPISRTSSGLREALFDEIDRLRTGKTDAHRANAVARLSSEIVNTVHMEIQVAKYHGQQEEAAALRANPAKPAPKRIGSVKLGTDYTETTDDPSTADNPET